MNGLNGGPFPSCPTGHERQKNTGRLGTLSCLRRAADSFPQSLEREAHAFEEDFAVELRVSGLALGKDDGELAEAGSAAMQSELHLHQEGVSLGADVVQIDLAQNLGAVADKSGGHVV